MATSINFTISEYKGATGVAGSPDYPKLLTLKTATEAAVDAEITARLATAVAVARKVAISVPVVAGKPTKRAVVQIPATASATMCVNWSVEKAITITGFKFIRSGTAPGTAVLSIDRITRSTGAVATALASSVDVAAGTNDAEQTFTPDDSAPPTTLAVTQSLAIRLICGAGAAPVPISLVIEYTEDSAPSGKGQATWFPGRAVTVTGLSYVLPETFVGATLVANLDDVVATTGVLVPLGTSQSIASATKDVVTTYTPDEAAGALPYSLTALKGLRFEVVADATTMAPNEVTFFVTYTDTAI